MPLTPYKQLVGPHALASAQAAFEMACPELSMPDDFDQQAARETLAKRITDGVIENGERDPERLKVCALEGFGP